MFHGNACETQLYVVKILETLHLSSEELSWKRSRWSAVRMCVCFAAPSGAERGNFLLRPVLPEGRCCSQMIRWMNFCQVLKRCYFLGPSHRTVLWSNQRGATPLGGSHETSRTNGGQRYCVYVNLLLCLCFEVVQSVPSSIYIPRKAAKV